MKTVYLAQRTEVGTNKYVTFAMFTNKRAAELATDKKGLHGHVGEGQLFETYHEYKVWLSDEIRRNALLKLTVKEIQALGIQDPG